MSHEIRTPMNGLIGMTALLLDTELDPEQREYTDTIHLCSDNLLTLINDILDFSKIEAGKLKIEQIDFDLWSLVEEVRALFSGKASAKKLQLTCQIHHEVPVWIAGDPGRLRQILLNLVGNAIKFTNTGTIVIEITGTAIPDSDAVALRFAVIDHGIGIAQDRQDHIFEAFTQADSSTTRHYGGTGLGLAIARQLVTLMDGTIGVESALDQGSTFWFNLQLVSRPTPPSIIKPADKRQFKGRILLVEDNVVNQKVARSLLEKFGCQVDVASNGREAIDAVNQHHYDLLFMDWQMPEIDGFAATTAIRQQEQLPGSHLPIIAMTANARAGNRERCLAAGMDDFLSKPVTSPMLETILQQWLQPAATIGTTSSHT